MSIVLRNLVKTYGPHTVVDNVSLEIADGELFVLLGASGSGKSTILRMIAGLVPVDSGQVLLHGRDVTDLPPQERNTGFVFQNYSLFQHMTVAENVEFGLQVRKRPPAERTVKRDELLALVGLAGFAGRYPSQLSGGQQQRVAVARALAFEPSVLLLDEPFGALDVKIRGALRRALRDIQRSLKVTTILVTHDQEEAFELADRIGVVDHGRLLEVGPPSELYRRPQHEFVATFVGEANLLGVRSDKGRVRVGELSLPLPVRLAEQDPGVRWAALFRPEELAVAREREELAGPVLGEGVVEEVLDLGAARRLRLRLQPIPGVWPLGRDFGEAGVALLAALPWKPGSDLEFRNGDQVWVGVRGYHLLPRLARKFLILVDGTSGSSEALEQGFRLARAMAANVTLLCVGPTQSAGERIVTELREALARQRPAPAFKLRVGDIVEELAGETAREAYDLVVAPGRSEDVKARLSERIQSEVVAGITSERLVGSSPFPVLVAHGPRPDLKRILLCTAAGEPGKLDVFFGGQVARTTGAAATLLFVDGPAFGAVAIDGGDGPAPDAWKRRFWIERHLEQGLQTLAAQGVQAQVSVRQGDALEQILAAAREGEHDLIVIGGHLVQTWADLPERDLSIELVARADRPVLVVKGSFSR
jgi:sulfate transport system ATP-binding protein